MNRIFILLFALLLTSGVKAQIKQPCSTCLPEGIVFTTQAQIDSFQVNYPNCTEIEGDVTINGEDISNLNGLNVVTYIGGDLYINWNDALTSITGLNNLTSIGSGLNIGNNPALTNLTGLEGLTYIGGYLSISYNAALTNLTGLDNLTSIGGYLQIGDSDGGNPALTSLTGLDNLTSIGGNLYINRNNALTSLTGLHNLISIGGSLYIGDLYSGGNPALTSLTGLDNLTSIGGNLYINGDDALTSLTGLDNIDAGSITDLYVLNNNSLSTCDAQSICEYLASPNGTVEIYGNATGCNSQQEVKAACGVGIDESATPNSHITIYPNPSSTTITISTPTTPNKNTFLTIIDITGKEVLKRELTQEQNVVDVSGLPQGVYFVRVADDRTVMVTKFIKQ